MDQYLTFMVDQQSYGIPISSIREINRVSEITRIPESPEHVAGLMNLRGKVIPVVTLRARMSLSRVENTKETCTIVVETSGGQVGVIVDAVRSVINLEKKDIDESPVQQTTTNYVFAVGKVDSTMVMLLDIEKCLGAMDQVA